MLILLLEKLFGCKHRQLTWPQGRAGQVHVTCGREFRYDWDRMRIGTKAFSPSPIREPQVHSVRGLKG
jgi:hypothetical protein